jgi:hypothetical protein
MRVHAPLATVDHTVYSMRVHAPLATVMMCTEAAVVVAWTTHTLYCILGVLSGRGAGVRGSESLNQEPTSAAVFKVVRGRSGGPVTPKYFMVRQADSIRGQGTFDRLTLRYKYSTGANCGDGRYSSSTYSMSIKAQE